MLCIESLSSRCYALKTCHQSLHSILLLFVYRRSCHRCKSLTFVIRMPGKLAMTSLKEQITLHSVVRYRVTECFTCLYSCVGVNRGDRSDGVLLFIIYPEILPVHSCVCWMLEYQSLNFSELTVYKLF